MTISQVTRILCQYDLQIKILTKHESVVDCVYFCVYIYIINIIICILKLHIYIHNIWAAQAMPVVKNLPANAGDARGSGLNSG